MEIVVLQGSAKTILGKTGKTHFFTISGRSRCSQTPDKSKPRTFPGVGLDWRCGVERSASWPGEALELRRPTGGAGGSPKPLDVVIEVAGELHRTDDDDARWHGRVAVDGKRSLFDELEVILGELGLAKCHGILTLVSFHP